MKTILVATDKPFAKIAIDQIKELVDAAGFKLQLLEKYTSVDQLLDAVKDVNAIIVRSDLITKQVVDAAKNLQIVVRAGAGYDNLDLTACSANNVVAMNTPGQNANAVAELAIGMMIMAARNMYNGTSGTELLGKKLGIHAYGNVGKYVAKIAKGFGMEVYAFDPFVSDDKIIADGVKPLKTVEELYKTCQYVSLHIPATEQTKKSINYQLLSLMPKGGVLVNTARKEVIDEVGIVKLMEEKTDFKYVSDVATDNITEFESKLKGRFYFTPKKLGAQTEEANVNAGVAAARQIIDFFKTGNETFRLNKK
jgi:D-3-phosphoglycerate dehydrogenase / 2-oxoglutarate reductase